MKLDKVCYPYSEEYKTAYLYTDKTGRKMIILYGEARRLTTAYARYLMSVKLGRFLTKEETVDHIDNDRSNDSIENLQLLSLVENIRKAPHIKQEKHGTNAQYIRGCRCDLCLEYSRPRQKRWRDRNPDKVNAIKARAKASGTIEKHCELCGVLFKVHDWERKRRFCSRSCATKFQMQYK